MNQLGLWIKEKLCELNLTESMNTPEGFTRLGYTNEEFAAHRHFINIARELGLTTYQDKAGNQWAVWTVDTKAPTIAMGSHLDTVHNGGGYDGVVGVLCALASIKLLKEKHFKPKKNIAVICFISEESARFGISTIGSKAIVGTLEKQKLADITDNEGITIKKAVEDMGLKWEQIDQAELQKSELDQFLELHIEQGKQLQENNTAIGIVKGIACPIRLLVKVSGVANHTGTTPMNQRSDAFVAAAPLVSYINDEALKVNDTETSQLVATVSTFKLMPNAMSIIPGEVELGIDIRSVDDELKRAFANRIKKYCLEIERKHNVSISITTLVDNQSVLLDNALNDKLINICNELGVKTRVMDSGAGHDVMNMARKWPVGLIFIPCKDGISHQPDEYATIDNLINGTIVLEKYLQLEA
ncbi:M20 family metallo-hydrolase [Virgibacillus byunsanensis]|uniref:M20 family metallo-hydrolase n=1 Tax=Virgibacillus byunsanensis TaxID=570945 RepID=A0ABW3LLR7_9BACI